MHNLLARSVKAEAQMERYALQQRLQDAGTKKVQAEAKQLLTSFKASCMPLLGELVSVTLTRSCILLQDCHMFSTRKMDAKHVLPAAIYRSLSLLISV